MFTYRMFTYRVFTYPSARAEIRGDILRRKCGECISMKKSGMSRAGFSVIWKPWVFLSNNTRFWIR